MKYFVFDLDGICYVGNSATDKEFLSLSIYSSDSYEDCAYWAEKWTTAPTFVLDF